MILIARDGTGFTFTLLGLLLVCQQITVQRHCNTKMKRQDYLTAQKKNKCKSRKVNKKACKKNCKVSAVWGINNT